jgi:4-hydroxy 2-oxovalerate aldolase
MDLIDVTLRDGGHAVKFDWGIDLAREYYQTISNIESVSLIEMGYWKQTAKTTNTFYNLNEDVLSKVIGPSPLKKVSVMIDYHYCQKEMSHYSKEMRDMVGMIRVCTRKTDISDSLLFAIKLKEHTQSPVSLNIFNISNYSESEISDVSTRVSEYNLDYVYFADTHGSLDFEFDSDRFADSVSLLKSCGIKVGMHLHDHQGRAYSNYKFLKQIGFTGFDASTRGMGKGVGNLRLEYVVNQHEVVKIMELVSKYGEVFTMKESPYGIIASKYNITDYYSYHAQKKSMSITEFDRICASITGLDKDVFNASILENN